MLKFEEVCLLSQLYGIAAGANATTDGPCGHRVDCANLSNLSGTDVTSYKWTCIFRERLIHGELSTPHISLDLDVAYSFLDNIVNAMTQRTAPYGTWESPITPEAIVEGVSPCFYPSSEGEHMLMIYHLLLSPSLSMQSSLIPSLLPYIMSRNVPLSRAVA